MWEELSSESTASPPLYQETRRPRPKAVCTRHLEATRERFALTMEGLRCICRALASLNLETCCVPSSRSSSHSNQRSTPAKAEAKAKAQAKGKGKGKAEDTSDTFAMVTSRYSKTESAPDCRKRCCEKKPQTTTARACPVEELEKGPCEDECCDDAARYGSVKDKKPHVGACVDLEKGQLYLEHVILSVSGMTCTGCEKKLDRVLSGLRQVTNVKTSLVTSRAEFDLDLSVASVDQTVQHVQNATGFDCESINANGAELELRLDKAPVLSIKGLTGSQVGRGYTRVFYDATMIGARELVRALGDPDLAPPRPDPSITSGAQHVRKLAFVTLASMLLTIPILVLAYAPLPNHEKTYGAISLALATLIQFGIAGPFYVAAFKSLFFSRMVELEFLIVLSTSAAYIFSIVSYAFLIHGHRLSTGEFFETSSLLVSLIMVGRFLSAYARQQAIQSVSVRSLQATTADIVQPEWATIDSRLLQYGDVFEVAPEASIVTDGTVVTGRSEVNETMITGEAIPVQKKAGSRVFAGSINGSGKLTVRLNRLPNENTVSTIASMVDQAKLSKPKVQDIVDKVASWFIPIIVAISTLTFVIWIGVGLHSHSSSVADAAIQAITYAIATMVVSCPCAIGLAVPMVITIVSGLAAKRHGIIFKEAQAIELAHKTSHVVFDKTGTLTDGKLTVTHRKYFTVDAASVLLGLVDGVKHPVSTAIARYLKAHGVLPVHVEGVRTVVGNGVEGTYKGSPVRCGNPNWLGLANDPSVRNLPKTSVIFCLTKNNTRAAVFSLCSPLRPSAHALVSELRRRKISISIVSGDSHSAVRSIASQLGMSDYHARCTPEAKKRHLEQLPKGAVSMFVGDGTNDAIALTQATIGIHIPQEENGEGGSEIAQNTADVVLSHPNLMSVISAIDLSCAAHRRIIFNFVWSGIYNLFAILLAAGAFEGAKARISPQYAGLGEVVSVVPVIVAAVLLRWVKVGGAAEGSQTRNGKAGRRG